MTDKQLLQLICVSQRNQLHLRDWRLRPNHTSVVPPALGLADQAFKLVKLGHHIAALQHGIEFFLCGFNRISISLLFSSSPKSVDFLRFPERDFSCTNGIGRSYFQDRRINTPHRDANTHHHHCYRHRSESANVENSPYTARPSGPPSASGRRAARRGTARRWSGSRRRSCPS